MVAKGLALLLLAIAIGQVNSNSCQGCYSFPDSCYTNTLVTDATAGIQGTGGGNCPGRTTCCPAVSPCLASTGRCCNKYQFKCQYCNNYGFFGYSSSMPAAVYGTQNQCKTSSSIITCPANYYQVQVASTSTCNFCSPNNCQYLTGSDCTVCTTCNPGYGLVQDGSCQLYPTLSASTTYNTVVRDVCVIAAMNATTDPSLSTATIKISAVAEAAGRQSTTGSTAVIASATCKRGTTTLFNINAVSGGTAAFPVGTSTLTCQVTDSNNLQTSCSQVITVYDQELPVLRCGSVSLTANSTGNSGFFNWSRTANATDNVGVTGSFCTGGPLDNVFVYNNGIPTVITCYAWDAASNNNTCSYGVTVQDVTVPQITCPPGVTVSTTLNLNTGMGGYAPAATDNCVTLTVTCTPAGTSPQPIGSRTVSCVAADVAGNKATCNFTLTVVDNQAPTMNCPSVYMPSASATAPNASVLLNVTVTDNSLQPVSMTCSPGGYPSAYTFPLGTTSVTCNAMDAYSNPASCTFPLTVVDRTAPILTCPNVAIVTRPGVSYSTLTTFASVGVTAVDNVNVASFSCSPPDNGAFHFPWGTTNVACNASDAVGNTASCSFVVTVTDNQNPVVNCPASISAASVATTNIPVNFSSPNATDNVGVNYTTLTVTVSGAPEYSLPTNTKNFTFSAYGSATFTYRAYDVSGRLSLCYWSVTVYAFGSAPDTTPPVIYNCSTPYLLYSLPSPDYNNPAYDTVTTINAVTLPSAYYALVTWNTLYATDNSGSVVSGYLDWSPNLVSASSNGLAAGLYVIAYSAIDPHGNAAYCVFRVNVTDNQAPAWANCPASKTYLTGAATGAVPTQWPANGVYATDNVAIANQYGTCTSVPSGYCPPGGSAVTQMLPVGVYSFTYNAVDTSGNNAIPCRFNVTVKDNSPPTMVGCSTNLITTSTSAGQSTADISGLCPVFTVTDNVGVAAVTYTSTPVGYNCSTPIPITTSSIVITITATDAANNPSYCFLVVTVRDTEAPVLSGCNTTADTIINRVCDDGKSTAITTLPVVSAVDNSGSSTITNNSFPAGLMSGSPFPLGTTTVTYTASDASNNHVSCNFRVVVSDTQKPVINGFPSLTSSYTYTLVTDPGVATATLRLPNLTSTDNVGISSSAFSPSSYVSNGQYSFAVGTTALSYTALDTSLNSVTDNLLITVTDNQAPIFSGCPSNTTYNLTYYKNTTTGDPNAPVSWPIISATDNADGVHVRISSSSIPVGFTDGSRFPVGTTVIIYTASDVAGNSRQCLFLVRVTDFEPPNLICPDNLTFTTDSYTLNYQYVDWREPIITDNDQIKAVDVSMFPRQNLTVGLYNVTYVATDVSGNVAGCIFFINVQLAAAPQASTSAGSAATIGAAGAAGGVGLIVLLVLLILFISKRNSKRKLQAAASGYAELMAMSDEFILERARAIQQALIESRQAVAPVAIQANIIHPERKFAAPPTGVAELEEYMRTVVCKEIPRESLEFGAELGAGEFGAVNEGFYLRPPPQDKLKVAIKMLRKATNDDDKARFLKEAAIMAQFNHPNIVSLTGVCTLPASEPTLIVLEYMHLGALHGYLQSPMVKGQLENLTMVRMALDVGQAMQYLSEANFVHRDLAARNVLLDKTMTCRVGDFGLSVDLASAEGEDGGLYSGQEGAKIPVRWTAIEAVCFRQFSTASDVWSYGILLWEIWSYAEMPYDGWPNKKVTEEVGNGYRLPKPAGCPDEIYRIMIDCWNKNVKRRITFAKINEALVQAWNDIANDNKHGSDDENGGGLYDNPDNVIGNGTLLDGMSDSESEDAPSPTKKLELDDDDDENRTTFEDVKVITMPTVEKVVEEKKPATPPPKPASPPPKPASPPPAKPPTPEPVKPVEPAKVVDTRSRAGGMISDQDVGKRVTVGNFGAGVLRFFGPHHRDGKPRCGVELDDAIGLNNGTIGDHKYFECEAKHGVLVDPRTVLLEVAKAANLMVNLIYDDSPAPAAAIANAVKKDDGYLAINADTGADQG